MHPVIEEIMRRSGAMPDPQAHRHYLETLTETQLQDHAQALREDGRAQPPPVEFWPRKRSAAVEAIFT